MSKSYKICNISWNSYTINHAVNKTFLKQIWIILMSFSVTLDKVNFF